MLLAVHRWAPRLTQAQWPCLPFVVPGVAKDVAQNMAAFFQKVFVDQTTFDADPDQTWTAGGEGPSMSPVDLAGELVSDTGTCKELGYQAFDFFKVNPVCQKIWIFPPVGALAVRSAETTFRRMSRLCRLFRWDFLRFAVRRGRSGEKELKERRLFLRDPSLAHVMSSWAFCRHLQLLHSRRWSSAPCRVSKRLAMVSTKQMQSQTRPRHGKELRHRHGSQSGENRRTNSRWTPWCCDKRSG